MQSLRAILFAVLSVLMLGSIAYAQERSEGFDNVAFDSTAERVESVLENTEASTAVLELLRSTLSKFRSQALDEQDSRNGRVGTITQQIEALGPIPEGGEAAAVATRRTQLNTQLSEAQAPLLVAEEAYRRADGLIEEIDNIVRARQSDAFFELVPTPLNPASWGPAFTKAARYLSGLQGEVIEAFSSQNRSKARLQKTPLILTLVLAGLALIFPIRVWVSNRMSLTAQKEQNLRRVFSSFVLSLGLLIAPMAGLFLLGQAVAAADLFLLRGEELFTYLPYVGLAIFGSLWISRNLFVADGPGARLLGLDASRLEGGSRTTLGVGIILALNLVLNAAITSEDWDVNTIAVLQLPLIFLGAFGLYRLSQKFRRYNSANYQVADTQFEPLPARVAKLLMWFCLSIAFLGPIAAAIGYVNLGAGMVFSTLLTLALIAALFLLYALLSSFVGYWHQNSETVQSEEVSSNVAGGLYRSALAFALICIAAPILALIWGARSSDIADVWLQLRDGFAVGDTRISISDFISFVLIFSIGYTVTRLIQSALRSSVLPNTKIDEAAQNSIVTGLGYVGIFLAALFAIMSTGLDLSNLAIVAGALSVGIGFGLQAIVSNFISGIILLAERPIKLGDWVEVGQYSGYVKDISVRSTSIETFDRATVIVPNADLITGAVTNWTHGNKQGRAIIPVGVAYGTDPERVKEILLEIANDNTLVLKLPTPLVLFRQFGADALEFELRVILRDVNYSLSATSEINFAIAQRFKDEGIEIPFAQREVTIKNPEAFGGKK